MFPSTGNLIFGLIGIAGGTWVIKEAYYLNHHIFFLAWAENKWGPGSGTLAYRLIGLGVVIFAVFVLTGNIDLFSSSFTDAPANSNQAQPSNNIPKSPSGNVQIAP